MNNNYKNFYFLKLLLDCISIFELHSAREFSSFAFWPTWHLIAFALPPNVHTRACLSLVEGQVSGVALRTLHHIYILFVIPSTSAYVRSWVVYVFLLTRRF